MTYLLTGRFLTPNTNQQTKLKKAPLAQLVECLESHQGRGVVSLSKTLPFIASYWFNQGKCADMTEKLLTGA